MCRVVAEQGGEGGIVAGGGKPVGKHGDRGAGQLVERRGDPRIDLLPVDRHRAGLDDV